MLVILQCKGSGKYLRWDEEIPTLTIMPHLATVCDHEDLKDKERLEWYDLDLNTVNVIEVDFIIKGEVTC